MVLSDVVRDTVVRVVDVEVAVACSVLVVDAKVVLVVTTKA